MRRLAFKICQKTQTIQKKTQPVEFSRKQGLDPFIINEYFQKLKTQLDELNLYDKPTNMESG